MTGVYCCRCGVDRGEGALNLKIEELDSESVSNFLSVPIVLFPSPTTEKDNVCL
jgi:hypothetical protein